MIQKFLPQVAEGDKRIILVDGEALGAVNRVPAGDDIRSNMVRGGAAAATELTARERAICARIGPELKRRGLVFVGIDVIDGWLTEINVTSPTGIRAVKRLGGPDLARGDLGRDRERKRRATGAARHDRRVLLRRPARRRGAQRARRPVSTATRSTPSSSASARPSDKADDAAFRRAAVEVFAAALEAGPRRGAARGSRRAARGRACARALSDLEDEIIRAVHDYGGQPCSRPGAADQRRSA